MKPDLNLLVVFDAVARFGSVTAAARHLALSQPAVSHALNRLRAATGDALFTRSGRGLVPTARAEAMRAIVRDLVSGAESILAPQTFAPATSDQVFRIGTSDYAALALIPQVLGFLTANAPNVRLDLLPAGRDALSQLEVGKLDLSFWGADPPSAPFLHQTLFDEHYVGVVRAGHPILARPGKVSLADYLRYNHAVVSLQTPGSNAIDRALTGRGLTRRVGLSSHSFAGNLASLPRTDLIASLPTRLCRALPPDLVLFDLPLPVPSYVYGLVWHSRTDVLASHAWLRCAIAQAVAAPGDSG
mgnify:CR=1 FL=1